VPSYVDSNNMSYVLPEGTDAEAYGVAPYDPTAPFGSAAAVEPAPPAPMMSAMPEAAPPPPMGGMSAMPPEQSAPMQTNAPVTIAPVNVEGEAPPQPAPFDPNQLDDISLLGLGLKREGPTRGQAYVPAHYQNQSRVGAFDDSEMQDAMANSTIDQKLALQRMGDAQLAQNNSEVLMARRREAQLDQMRADAAAKERAIKSQVDRDRAEYENMKREHMKSANDPRGAFSTVAGGLSTIFGMLAIGMASRGSRENLQATISSVHSNIDRHVQAQRAETHAKGEMADNAYARFLRTYKDADQAEAATKSLLNERAMAELDRMGAQSKDPIIQANVQQGMAQLGANLAENQAALRERSIGKTAEAWNVGQQARAGSSGGLRALTLDEKLKYGDKLADLRDKQAGTEKTAAEVQKLSRESTKGAETKDVSRFQDKLAQIGELEAQMRNGESFAQRLEEVEANEGGVPGFRSAGVPILSRAISAAETQLPTSSGDMARELQSDYEGLVLGSSKAILGGVASDSETERIANTMRGSGGAKGTKHAVRKMNERLAAKARELRGTLPPDVLEFHDKQRSSVGADRPFDPAGRTLEE
jgi:hypothetical protein